MPTPVTRLRLPLALAAIAAALSLTANADDQDIRIGRYQAVAVNAPLQEIEVTPHLQPLLLPDEVTTRGAALRWIAQQHGYQLHADTEHLLAAAAFLSTALLADERQRPGKPLRTALLSLLNNHADVLIDSGSKKVALLIDTDAAEVTGGADGRN